MFGPVVFDAVQGSLQAPGLPEVHLTPTEAQLLAYLGSRGGESVGRDELLREVWGYAASAKSRTVDSTVNRVRNKLRGTGIHIHTKRGEGLRLEVEAHEAPKPVVEEPASAPIGRDADLERLRADLAVSGAVALVGPPGIGKSELARWWCELQGGDTVDLHGITEASELLRALAAALGVGSRDPEKGLRERLLQPRPVVLDAIDALEPAAVSRVAALLHNAVAPVVLTARRPPAIAGLRTRLLGELDAVAAARVAERSRAAQGLAPLGPERCAQLVDLLGGLPLALVVASPVADWLDDPRLALDLRVPGPDGTLASTFDHALIRLPVDALEVAHALAAVRAPPPTPRLAAMLGWPLGRTVVALSALQTSGFARAERGCAVLLPALRAVLRDSPNHRMAGDAAGQRAVDHLLALPAALDVLAPLASDIESALAGAEGTRRLDLLHRHIDLLARRGPIGDLTAQAERWTRSLPSELFADGLVERARARLAETIKVDVDLLAGAVAHVVSPGRRAVALAMLARARSWTNDPRTPEATEAALAALSPDLPTIDRIQASGHLAASLQAVDPARALAVLDAAWELAWPRYPYEALSLLLVRTFVEPMDALAREQARHLLGRVRPHLCAPAWAEAEAGMAVALVDAGEVEAGWELVLDVLPVFEADPSLPVAAFLSNLALRLVFEPERLEVLLPHLRGYNSRGFERFIEGFITGEDGELPEDWAQIRSALVNGDPLPAVADRRLSRVGMGLRVALRNRR